MSLSSQNTQSTSLNSQNVTRRQHKLSDGIRQRSIRSIIASDSSNSKIIYVYCSPKLKNALTFLLRFIVVAYCITVPLFVYLLHKESSGSIEKLKNLEERLNLNKRAQGSDSQRKKRQNFLSSGVNKSLKIGHFDFKKNYQTIPLLKKNVRKEIDELNKTIEKYGIRMKKLQSVEEWIYMVYNSYAKKNNSIQYPNKCFCSEASRKTNDIKNGTNLKKTFIYWGSATCNNSIQKIVYKGFMSGALSRPDPNLMKQGGGVNYLCLPDEPLYSQYSKGHSQRRTYIDSVISGKSFVGLENRAVTCSLCEVSGKTDTVMIPGRHDCDSDWDVEYRGYIATSGKKNERSEYVCVDRNLGKSVIPRDRRSHMASLELVSLNCNSNNLLCGNAKQGSKKILPCVVCSR